MTDENKGTLDFTYAGDAAGVVRAFESAEGGAVLVGHSKGPKIGRINHGDVRGAQVREHTISYSGELSETQGQVIDSAQKEYEGYLQKPDCSFID